MSKSSSMRSSGCGELSCFTKVMKRLPSVRLNAASSSFEPQFETKATGYTALAISRCAVSMAVERSTGWPFFIACDARGRSKIRARSRPLLQIHGPLTAGFSSGVTRSMLTFFAGSSVWTFHSALRCQICTVQPRAHPGQIEGVGFRYQTRALYRNDRDSKAPTGQISITLSEYGSASSARSSEARTSDASPRCVIPKAFDFEISRVKRTQREQRMQRSLSSRIRSDNGWNLVERTLTSRDTDGAPLYS